MRKLLAQLMGLRNPFRSAGVSTTRSSATRPKRLRFESLEARLVLSAVLPFSQLGISSSGIFSGGAVDQAFSGEGLTGALHSDLWHEGWLSDGGGAAGEWIKIDLGGTYDLDYLRVWNGNQIGLTSRGIKQADIYVALSDPGSNANNSSQAFDPSGWTLAVANQRFTKSPGGVAVANTDPQISLGGVQAAYLAIRVDSSWGDAYVALSEMQIYVNDGNVTTFPFVVNNGSGDGAYTQGTIVAVAADPAPGGQVFDSWTGDTSFLVDILDSTTTFTMPAAAATISASYRIQPPTGEIETWQIDFEATQPTHPSLFSITSDWDAGFGTKWNTYTNPMRNGAAVPPQTGHTESDLNNAKGGASVVDFSIVSGTTLGMIAGYVGGGIEDTIYSVTREHLFWGGDTNTSNSIGFEFSDLSPGTYDITFITNAQWHIPHRGFNIAVDGQSVDFHPEAGGNEVILNGILSYKKANLDIKVSNITVTATGVLAGTLTELEAFSDPSLAGIILTQTSVPPEPKADFDSDGDVDGADFLSWQRGFGTDVGSGNVAPLVDGNANSDQSVDGDDLNIWQGQFGQIATANLGPANLALDKTVTVSSEPDPTERPDSGATDGVKNIHWRSAAPPSSSPIQWRAIDLEQHVNDVSSSHANDREYPSPIAIATSLASLPEYQYAQAVVDQIARRQTPGDDQHKATVENPIEELKSLDEAFASLTDPQEIP